MGVPSFFRWLASIYPKILRDAKEILPETDPETGKLVYKDCLGANPNEVEYDCLYLDMNGIIHPCTHPENGRPAPRNEEEMMVEIFHYLDRIFNVVRPRRLVYFAIDGVAPRAKMNQQRTRRFKSVRERKNAHSNADEMIGFWKQNVVNFTEDEQKASWDYNQITPGTPFMQQVANCLQFYIRQKISTDPAWRNISCFLSDSNVPGEGEHKLMEYIRFQHSQEGYNPNTRHCICGLDADLIMLGLATHEPHFDILRENVLLDKKPNVDPNGKREDWYRGDPFHFLRLSVLREYLAIELKPTVPVPFGFNLERAIDDYVFFCFLVGNDFLPHIPTLEISEAAVTNISQYYRELLPTLKGYLTENGTVHFDRVQPLLERIAKMEDNYVTSKAEHNAMKRDEAANYFKHAKPFDVKDYRFNNTLSVKENVRRCMRQKETMQAKQFYIRQAEEDHVQIGTPGWRERYYRFKFNKELHDKEFLRSLTHTYAEGLQWVMKYYYQGCASWEWYYPYHYAPFINEVRKMKGKKVDFPKNTKPFTPFEQLLSVLPAESGGFLPPALAELMVDQNSPLLPFYPSDFEEDANGKPYGWQAIALLPFIDEKLLKKTMHGLEDTFTDEERKRNGTNQTLIFCHASTVYAQTIVKLKPGQKRKLKGPIFGGVSIVNDLDLISDDNTYASPVSPLYPTLENNECFVAAFHHPKVTGPFVSHLRAGVVLPPSELNGKDDNFDYFTDPTKNLPLDCRTFGTYGKCPDPNCRMRHVRFTHQAPSAGTPNSNCPKLGLCRQFRSPQGCAYGANCRFSHDQGERRNFKPNYTNNNNNSTANNNFAAKNLVNVDMSNSIEIESKNENSLEKSSKKKKKSKKNSMDVEEKETERPKRKRSGEAKLVESEVNNNKKIKLNSIAATTDGFNDSAHANPLSNTNGKAALTLNALSNGPLATRTVEQSQLTRTSGLAALAETERLIADMQPLFVGKKIMEADDSAMRKQKRKQEKADGRLLSRRDRKKQNSKGKKNKTKFQ